MGTIEGYKNQQSYRNFIIIHHHFIKIRQAEMKLNNKKQNKYKSKEVLKFPKVALRML